ncbi:hypothetical protein RRU01S_15_00980 [Agrobacterium rubi TR3 = NBRC 13261]|uniref:Uncharacterized protein n=1 Tax=Agrobacterium rubi TR3 = NBRC 13261 TaxID=1368415 RepID=A0A081CWX7_9HYPH|nr:hypothetical protein [Agrobacterium rubi]MBP1878140.1 hypothetical protein [Agrobacterium rubi]MCL6651704.1 hypothetical protein [Agrobacterium rubi]GAK71173.1 hypothetical protein RRU01S_15_00980 [Agrobacterium rubi TR3 = NBRC 13261]
MVSGLATSVKLLSTELALKAIQSHEAAAPHRAHFSQSETDEEVSHIETTIIGSTPTPADEPVDADTTDIDLTCAITDPAFLKSLKTRLLEMSDDPTCAFQGQAMLKAADASTLKIFDPIEGVVLTAWGDAATQDVPGTIDAIGWSPFLKQHIQREHGTAYAKDENGSYIDIMSGESAYFGSVGNKYYYFTWPQ